MFSRILFRLLPSWILQDSPPPPCSPFQPPGRAREAETISRNSQVVANSAFFVPSRWIEGLLKEPTYKTTESPPPTPSPRPSIPVSSSFTPSLSATFTLHSSSSVPLFSCFWGLDLMRVHPFSTFRFPRSPPISLIPCSSLPLSQLPFLFPTFSLKTRPLSITQPLSTPNPHNIPCVGGGAGSPHPPSSPRRTLTTLSQLHSSFYQPISGFWRVLVSTECSL